MRYRETSTERLRALQAALKAAEPDDTVTLDTMMALWGCSKGTMVRIRDAIPNFPTHTFGPNKTMLWPARAALEKLIDLETKDARAAEALAARQAKILGTGKRRGRKVAAASPWSIGEMSQMARLTAEIEAREREQGSFVPIAANQVVAGKVFSLVSGYLSQLSSHLDPNGTWTIPQRVAADAAGKELLLKMHAEMKHILGGNVPARRPNAGTARKASDRAIKPKARRQG